MLNVAETDIPVTQPTQASLSKAERKRLYLSARLSGSSITEASRIAGIHRKTGHNYERIRKQAESDDKALEAQRLAIATKDEVELEMSRLMKEAEYPADRIKAAQVLNATRGYNAPTRALNVTVTAPAGVLSWLDQLDARMLPGNDSENAPADPTLPSPNPNPPKQIGE